MNTRFGSLKLKEKLSNRLCERVCGQMRSIPIFTYNVWRLTIHVQTLINNVFTFISVIGSYQ